MEILIVGAGNMARGIGSRLANTGHRVRVAHRDLGITQALALELSGNIEGEELDGPGGADIVVLAVPYPADREIAQSWASDLTGTIVIDIANPIDFATFDHLVTPSSAAEEVAEAAPAARVIKAFNTIFAKNLEKNARLDLFIAGDDADARSTVANLAVDANLRPIHVGGLKYARIMENLQLLHTRIQEEIKGGFATAISVTTPDESGG